MLRAVAVFYFLLIVPRLVLADTSLPPELKKAWHLKNSETGSIAHSKKKFKHLKFDNNKEMVIVIIDTGVDFSHPFLKDHHFKIEGKSVDYNFFIGSNTEYELTDHHTHGTHVTGIVLSTIKKINSKANVKFISLKVFPSPKVLRTPKESDQPVQRRDLSKIGYYTKEAANYIVKLKKKGVNIVAVNASFGGSEFDKEEYEAVKTLLDHDILLVAAAGNDGTKMTKNGSKFYPAAYSTDLPGIISVGNITRNGSLTEDSNFGSIVSILAPGSKIMSTLPGGQYGLKSGTSMSTPQVTAAVSLIKSLKPDWNAHEIKSYLLKNSRFNTSYLQKTGSASRLDLDLLFKAKKKSYDFKTLSKLKEENFVNKKGKIIKNTHCTLGANSLLLCGPLINKKIVGQGDTKRSIVEIMGKRNLKAYEQSYMNISGGERIIESSLMSMIHGISKNDEIFKKMLTKGFQFKDLYLALGPGLLKKYYDSNIIIPVLNEKAFLAHYPFAASDVGSKKRAYAKYIEGLINSPPQYLDRVGAAYFSRATPKTSIETALVKAFPLPLNSYIVSHMAERRMPDMIGSLQAIPNSTLKKPIHAKNRKKIELLKNLNQNIMLTKSDLKYLKQKNSLRSNFAKSLGSSSSFSAPKGSNLQKLRKETENKLTKPIKIVSVNNAKPIDKKQSSPPRPASSIVNRINKLESLLEAASKRVMNKSLKTLTNRSNPKSQLVANFSVKNKGKQSKKKTMFQPESIGLSTRSKPQHRENLNFYMEQELKHGSYSKNNNTYQGVTKNQEANTNLVNTSRGKNKTIFGGKATGRNSNNDQSTDRRNKKPNNILGAKDNQNGVSPPNTTFQTLTLKTKEDGYSKESFLCTPDKYDELFKQLDSDIKKGIKNKNMYVGKIFCKSATEIPYGEIQKVASTLEHYNLCKLRNNKTDKSFSELISPGFGQTSCDKQEIIKPCFERIKEDIVNICDKILPHASRYESREAFRGYLARCRASALDLPGVRYQYIENSVELYSFMNKFKDFKKINCQKIRKKNHRALKTFFSDLLVNVKYNFPYKASKAKKKIQSDPENLKSVCVNGKTILSELKLEYGAAIDTGKTLYNQRPAKDKNPISNPEDFTTDKIKVWLLTSRRLDLVDDYTYQCSPKYQGSSSGMHNLGGR